MGATEEQMSFLSAANVTHVSYILILYSIAFLLYLFVNILLHIYATHTWPDDESNGQIALAKQMRAAGGRGVGAHSRNVSFVPGLGLEMSGRQAARMGSVATGASPFLDVPDENEEDETRMNGHGHGHGRMNGHVRPKTKPRLPVHRATDSQQVRDAEEFELEGLISDVDEDADDVQVEDGNGKKGGQKEMV